MTQIPNQRLQKETWYACTLYTMLNIIKYDYKVTVKIDWVLKLVNYMERIGALLPNGAYFSVIYPAMVKVLEWKTGLKFKIEVWYISQWLSDDYWRGLWFKHANKFYQSLAEDWELTKDDIDQIKKNNKWAGHNHMLKRNIIVESLWGYYYEVTPETLKYAVEQWVYYDTARTILPWDERTEYRKKRLNEIYTATWKYMSWEKYRVTQFD